MRKVWLFLIVPLSILVGILIPIIWAMVVITLQNRGYYD